MKVQLIGGPAGGTWVECREGQRTLSIAERPKPMTRAMTAADAAMPVPMETCREYTYLLMAHDNATFTFEYQG